MAALGLGIDEGVVLAEDRAALAVSEDRVLRANLLQHPGTDLAGEGTLLLEVHVLRGKSDLPVSGLPFGGASGNDVTSVDLELDPYTIANTNAGMIKDDWEAVLYVSNLTGLNRLYRNNGDGTFRDVAVEIASVPERIRGYGHVKQRHLDEAKAMEAALLADYRAGRTGRKAVA